jgi:cation transport ATPase
MVSEAQRSRAPIRHLADQVSSCFVTAVIASSVVTSIVWYLVSPQLLAARVLFPAFGLLLNSMIAAAAMSFTFASVNSKVLRLRTTEL